MIRLLKIKNVNLYKNGEGIRNLDAFRYRRHTTHNKQIYNKDVELNILRAKNRSSRISLTNLQQLVIKPTKQIEADTIQQENKVNLIFPHLVLDAFPKKEKLHKSQSLPKKIIDVKIDKRLPSLSPSKPHLKYQKTAILAPKMFENTNALKAKRAAAIMDRIMKLLDKQKVSTDPNYIEIKGKDISKIIPPKQKLHKMVKEISVNKTKKFKSKAIDQKIEESNTEQWNLTPWELTDPFMQSTYIS